MQFHPCHLWQKEETKELATKPTVVVAIEGCLENSGVIRSFKEKLDKFPWIILVLSVELPRSSCLCKFRLVCAFMMWLQKRSNHKPLVSPQKENCSTKHTKLNVHGQITKKTVIYIYIRILKTYPQKPSKYEAHTIQPLSLLLYLLTYHLQDLFKKTLDIFFLIRITNNSSIQAKARHLKTESAPNARKPSIVLQLLEVNWNMSRRCCKIYLIHYLLIVCSRYI